MKKRITILGAGISGTGAALLASSKGYDVFVSDMAQISSETEERLNSAGINWEDGGHTPDLILNSDEIIKSPGIPFSAPIVKTAIESGIPVIDELEFAARYTDAITVLITGSNGKTTTTLLTEHLLRNCGMNAKAVGNVGVSMAQTILEAEYDVLVIEASSFQLDGMREFRADVAILLNITPDHINWYGSMEAYSKSKRRIYTLLKEKGLLIYNADDTRVSAPGLPVNSKSVSLLTSASAFADDNLMILDPSGKNICIENKDMLLRGDHNRFNAMCAALAVINLGGSEAGIRKGLSTFNSIEHRLEFIDSIGGVDFINDSKATNVDAVQYALGSFERPLIWIAGGVDKGNNYEQIRPLVREKVEALVCLGVDNKALKTAFDSEIDRIIEVSSMESAVRSAWELSGTAEIVLLSPACASFDLFKNYMDRGDQFKKAVIDLKTEVERSVQNA